MYFTSNPRHLMDNRHIETAVIPGVRTKLTSHGGPSAMIGHLANLPGFLRVVETT